MKKTLLILLGVSSIAMSKTVVSAMPYSAYIDYTSPTKDKAYVVGLYSSFYNFPNKLEVGLENITIKYKNGTPDLDQNDLTAIYTRYIAKNYFVKGGLHYVNSDDKLTNHGIIGILGVNYYKYLKYNLGLDVYYSDYKDYTLKSLKVLQLRPYVGFNFGNYNSKLGSFYLETDYNYIKPKDASLHGFSNSYNSFGLKLTNYKGKFTTSIDGWAGKRVFAVDNGGFTVYNLGEVYKAGTSASVDYAIKPTTHVKLKYSYSKFDETGKKAHSNTVTASLAHTW